MSQTVLQMRRDPWYRADDYQAHDKLFALVQRMRDTDKGQRKAFWQHYRLFDRRGLEGTRYARTSGSGDMGPRLSLNVVRAAVLAVHSKIVGNKPRPTFLTLGAGHSARQKAKATQSYSDGCIYHQQGYSVAADAALHSAAFGTGAVFSFMGADGRPACENVLLAELDVERHDGRQCDPLNIYRTHTVHRDELREQFKADDAALRMIDDAPDAGDAFRIEHDETADLVAVCDAYRRGCPDDADSGRHVLALENGSLVDETWSRGHPFSFLRWGKRPRGMWGYGIAEQLRDLQFEINVLLLSAQEQMAFAGPKIAVQRGTEINEEEINNEIWGLIHYTGAKPEFFQVQSVDPALLQQIDTLYQRAFDEVGVSQMAVRSEKPAGLNSGKALLTYSDLESAKFVTFGQGYENLLREMAMQNIDIALAVEDDDKRASTITYPTRKYRARYLERISIKEIVSTKDDYVCQVFPTSALAQTPSAKQQQVGEMSDRGWIDAPTAIKLLDFPDLDDETSLMSSRVEYVDMLIDRMLEEGEPVRAEPWLDISIAIPRVSMALLRAQIEGVPEERWELLGLFIDSCREVQQAQQKALAPPAAPPGVPPQLPPGGPPPEGP